MFLQQRRLGLHRETSTSPSPRHSTRLEQAVKEMSIPEIKSHQKNKPQHNIRKFLIQYTQKLFKEERRAKPEQYLSMHQSNTSHIKPYSRQSRRPSEAELSNRESRTAAARIFRSKISKKGDITPLIQAQEQLSKSRQTQNLNKNRKQVYSQRVGRYQDLLNEFSSQIKAQKKELIKSHWLALTSRANNFNPRLYTSRNPQIQVTNIEFNQEEESLPSRMVISRDKRRDMGRRGNHISYTGYGRRQHKTHLTHIHHDDNYIQPW